MKNISLQSAIESDERAWYNIYELQVVERELLAKKISLKI